MVTQTVLGFPLSPQQKRLWTLQQRNLAATRACALVSVDGELDRNRLFWSLQTVRDRHESLRATFHKPAGMKYPLQAIEDRAADEGSVLDLQHLSPSQQAAEIEQFWQSELQATVETPWRIVVFVLAENCYRILFSLNALCADAQSLNLLIAEVGECYATGDLTDVDDIVQYPQFVEWQNQLLAEEAADIDVSPTRIRLPLATTPEPSDCRDIRRCSIPLDAESLQRQSCQLGYAPDEWLRACWLAFLGRLSGEWDLTIGDRSEGRSDEELEAVIGVFAKSLPLRVAFEGSWTWRELLAWVRSAREEGQTWQDYFDPANAADFPVGFEWFDADTPMALDGVTFAIDRICVPSDRFELCLSCDGTGDGLDVALHYDAGIYDESAIARWTASFATLLRTTVHDPDCPIARLDWLDDRQRQVLLADFNATRREFPTDRPLHRLFEDRVVQRDGEIAVQFEGQSLTYGEVNRRANQLAHYLQRLGIEPESRVAIGLDRSPEAIVVLLGILKAGAAYVPIDPTMPEARSRQMLLEAGVSALVTRRDLRQPLPHADIRVIDLSEDKDAIAAQSARNPDLDISPNRLAYVIFTSGSTGTPKGVGVEHRQVLNYLYGIADRLQLGANAHYATVSTLAADLGNTAIFPALCLGGCLHVLSADRIADAAAFADYCQQFPIDGLKIAPSHLQALLESDRAEAILPRSHLILGGETLRWDLVERIRQLAPNCRIFNHYGPTETTIGALTYAVEPHPAHTVPLGRPLPNTEVYLLDAFGNPVPMGIAGEIYIGGAGVARGYLNRDSDRFGPHPFGGTGRVYRTGDLGRYHPDGNLEFLGRADDQVKIRGFRVELGEIAAVLGQHPGVKEATVVAQKRDRGDTRLDGYVALKPGQGTDEIRDWARSHLPAYMVPATLTPLKALPRTASGKIDRQGLPEVAVAEAPDPDSTIAPRTSVERQLADIWRELLQVETVGIQSNFFELGGHSLLATQAISRVRSTFGVELPLRRLFETPTIAGLAAAIEQAIAEQADETDVMQLLEAIERSE